MDESEIVQQAEIRQALAHADTLLSGIPPILGHLLSAPDQSLFSDEVIARVRGMLSDLARQVLVAQASVTGPSGCDAFVARHHDSLSEHFKASTDLLSHCHALSVEWQLAERLETEIGLDPVMPPLLARILSEGDATASSAAMAILAAQARFAQSQRRMELPLGQLPGDLFHQALLAWRDYCGHSASDAVARTEEKLRHDYDESGARPVLLARIIALPGVDQAALAVEDAGTGLFFSALAACSGQSRDLAVLSSHPNQVTRLAIGLRACGLQPHRIDESLLRLHPGSAPIGGLETISAEAARSILADSAHRLDPR